MKKTTKLAVGVPMRLDANAVAKIPAPKPSRAQVVEALVELKFQQFSAEFEAYKKATSEMGDQVKLLIINDLRDYALTANQLSIPSVWGTNDKGQPYVQSTSISVEAEHLSAPTRKAICDYRNRDKDAPSLENDNGETFCGHREDDMRNFIRRDIIAKLAKQEGTGKDRLKVMLNDKSFRTTMETMLSKIEGNLVEESAGKTVEA